MRRDCVAPARARGFFSAPMGGFTLKELMLTVGIITLVSTFGVGSFNRHIGDTHADTIILNLRTALMLARTEAIKRSASVVLCRRAAGSGQCAGSGAKKELVWDKGWLLFVDANENKVFDNGEILVREFPPINTGFALKWNRGDYIAYKGSGALHSRNGSFCLGSRNLVNVVRELKIPRTGRVRVTSGECSYSLLP